MKKQFFRALQCNLRRSGWMEKANLYFIGFAILISWLVNFKSAPWLLFAIIFSDIARYVLCGYWYLAPFHGMAHEWCPQKDVAYKAGKLLKMTFYGMAFISGIINFFVPMAYVEATGIVSAYIVTGISVFEMLRTLAHVLQKYDKRMLASTFGEFGPLELSISCCIVICVINAHIIATECFGSCSIEVAAVVMALYIILAEPINYFIYKKYEPANRLYGWGEHFAQKLFFITHTIAIMIAIGRHGIMVNNYSAALILLCISLFAITSTVITAIFHLNGRWDINCSCVQSYVANSIRRWAIYVFAAVGLIAIRTESVDAIILAFLLMIAIVIVSIVFILFEESGAKDNEVVDYSYDTYTGPY